MSQEKKITDKHLKKIEKTINEDLQELGSYRNFSSENRTKITNMKLRNGKTVQVQVVVTLQKEEFI